MIGRSSPTYLDCHATTPVDPRVVDAMLPFFTETFGNAASKTHVYGNDALSAVEESRGVLAKAINAKPQEVVFTSGATEAVNLAIKGVALASRSAGGHFVTVATEHKAVLDCFRWLASEGLETTIIDVDSNGLVEPEQVRAAIRSNTLLVAVMAANNEIGVLQPLEEIGQICRAAGAYFFTDATQALGRIALDVQRCHIDLLAASAHKVYGPKGIGMLYARRSNPRVTMKAQIDGGGHEHGLRSGTLPTPQIVGFKAAVAIALKEMAAETSRIKALRDSLERTLLQAIPEARVNGHSSRRLAGNLNITLPGVESEAMMIALRDELAISSGSACTSAAVMPSHVLKALGLSDEAVHSSLRFGVGRFTTDSQIQAAGDAVVTAYRRLSMLRRSATAPVASSTV